MALLRRRHDGNFMGRSRLIDRLRYAQEGNPTQYYACGDTVHAVMPHLKRDSSRRQLGSGRVNRRIKNAFGKVCNLWGPLDHQRNLTLKQNPVGDVFLVGMLLTNIYTCKYGSQVTVTYY
ncbi:unnamed protein product, partial [Discosporangium mesarthrocarpum]